MWHYPSAPSLSLSGDDELTVCVSMINALLLIHADTGDWKRSLKLLDEAIRDMPHTHRL